MTVSFLFGWEDIVTVLALLVAVAVAFLVIAATALAANPRSEWRAWLDGRSASRRLDAATDPHNQENELAKRRLAHASATSVSAMRVSGRDHA